jgi:hypothetical protein
MPEETITPEEISNHYNAALSSVALINRDKMEGQTDLEWKDELQRNVEHLQIMLSRTYWTTEDLTPFQDAIATGNDKIANLP